MTENTPTTKPTRVAESVRSVRHRVDGDGPTGLVLGAALVAMALVAGLNYTFAVAVMPNLAGADDRTFVATMQRFNENPAFQLSFIGALVLTALAVVLQRRHGPGVAVRWTVVALVLYGIVLAVTAGLHIPLNYELVRAGDPDRIADLAHVRNQFEGPWVAGNIVRSLLATAAVAALARALFLHGRSTADRTA
ncbi:MAG: anthrone oxygenase family protein [Pseudonocardiales bacterium]